MIIIYIKFHLELNLCVDLMIMVFIILDTT